MTDSKTVIIHGRPVTLYRVRGFVWASWTSSSVEVEVIEGRRAREWSAIRQSGSEDVKRTLGEMEVD